MHLSIVTAFLTSQWEEGEVWKYQNPVAIEFGADSFAKLPSLIGKRLTRALEYVVENGATPEYREYLQTLSDRDADRSHANYTLIRFVGRVNDARGGRRFDDPHVEVAQVVVVDA